MKEIFDLENRTYTPLYHCIPVTPLGECIYPSDNYGTEIPPDVCAQLGIEYGGQEPLVFATPYMAKTLSFGLQAAFGEKLFNMAIDGSDNEVVLACDRRNLVARPRDMTVYEVPSERFVPLEGMDQYVCTGSVSFEDTKIAFRGYSADDLMRGGLQILVSEESYDELGGGDFVERTMQERGHDGLYDFLRAMLHEGKLAWENQIRRINPDPALAVLLGRPLDHPPRQPNF